ncbi:hypothetical protein ACFX19_040898 [Malus domestica]
MYANSASPSQGLLDVYPVIDWESLVIFPKNVTFKGRNDRNLHNFKPETLPAVPSFGRPKPQLTKPTQIRLKTIEAQTCFHGFSSCFYNLCTKTRPKSIYEEQDNFASKY